MADPNRLELDIVATDQSGPATAKAKANFQSIEQQAAKSAAGMSTSFGRSFAEISTSVERSMAVISRTMLHGAEAVGAFIATEVGLKRFGAALAAEVPILATHTAAMGAWGERLASVSVNAARAFELIATGFSLPAVASVSAGIALHAAARATYGEGQTLNRQSIQAGLSSFPITPQRIGEFDLSGSGTALFGLQGKAPNSDLRQIAQVMSSIPDLTDRARYAMKAFGGDQEAARTALGLLDERFVENTDRIRDWNLVISGDTKRNVQEFTADVDSLGHVFDSLKDTITATLRQAKAEIISFFADSYVALKQGAANFPALFTLPFRLAGQRFGLNLSPGDNALNSSISGLSDYLGDAIRSGGQRTPDAQLTVEANRLIREKVQGRLSSGKDFPQKLIPDSLTDLAGLNQPASGLDALREQLARQNEERSKVMRDAFEVGPGGKIDYKDSLSEVQKAAARGSLESINGAIEDTKKQIDAATEAQSNLSKASETVLAARREREQLQSQLTQFAETSKLKNIREGLDAGKELAAPEDIQAVLALTRAQSERETQARINERRYSVDSKGRTVDLSNTSEFQQYASTEQANGVLRLKLETEKALQEFTDSDAKYFKARSDADFQAFEETQKRKTEAQHTLVSEMARLDTEARNQYYQSAASDNERQREAALANLGLIDAQSLSEKRGLEDEKLAIEAAYADRALQLQTQQLQAERDIRIGELQGVARQGGYGPGSPEYDSIAGKVSYQYDSQIRDAQQATAQQELIDAQQVANQKARLVIEENHKVYESLKSDVNGFFEAMFSSNRAESLKRFFKNLFLKPAEDILSSQTSAALTHLLTGEKVAFDPIGNGQGVAGRAGGILGRLGLGQPRFGTGGINAPNHIGDVSLVSGAVPVVLANAPEVAQQHAQATGVSFAPLVAGLGTLAGATLAAASTSAGALQTATTSTIRYATGGSDSFGYGSATSSVVRDLFGNPLPGAPAFGGGSAGGGIFSWLAPIVGGPGGTGGFAGRVGGGLPGILGGLKSLTGIGTSGTDLGNGVGIANTGILGHLAAFGKSDGAGILGGTAALDGFRRGGVAGTLEATAGGALAGFKYGGPIGALIGGAAGGLATLFKSIFGKSDTQHAKDLVKQVWGMSINDATANQIVEIAKQSYGGQIDVAVRSPQVRQLLQLYSQATGQKSAEDRFVQDSVHSASLIQSGGKLLQGAVYDNGNAYSYQSPLSVYGGVQTSGLSTYAPNQGVSIGNLTLSVNGQSASDLLAGQVASVATPGYVQAQAQAASQSSIGRNTQTALTLAPSAISR